MPTGQLSGWKRWTAAAWVAAVVSVCHAGPHQREFAAELAVMAGDARLLSDSRTTAAEAAGLEARLDSALSSLGILARYALEESRRRDDALLAEVARLRDDFAQGRRGAFARRAAALASRYPLDLSNLSPSAATSSDIQAGRQIYQGLCRGCHEHGGAFSPTNPPQDLFQQARDLPETEFMARLLNGVHGTPAVALKNPFSEAELAGLAAYLQQHRP